MSEHLRGPYFLWSFPKAAQKCNEELLLSRNHAESCGEGNNLGSTVEEFCATSVAYVKYKMCRYGGTNSHEQVRKIWWYGAP